AQQPLDAIRVAAVAVSAGGVVVGHAAAIGAGTGAARLDGPGEDVGDVVLVVPHRSGATAFARSPVVDLLKSAHLLQVGIILLAIRAGGAVAAGAKDLADSVHGDGRAGLGDG